MATSTNVAYEMRQFKKETEDSYDYYLVDQNHPPVKPPTLSKSEEEQYEIPNPPKMYQQPPALPTVPPPTLSTSQEGEGEMQEETVYEPIPGDK